MFVRWTSAADSSDVPLTPRSDIIYSRVLWNLRFENPLFIYHGLYCALQTIQRLYLWFQVSKCK